MPHISARPVNHGWPGNHCAWVSVFTSPRPLENNLQRLKRQQGTTQISMPAAWPGNRRHATIVEREEIDNQAGFGISVTVQHECALRVDFFRLNGHVKRCA